jgi:putative membrane protein
MPMMYGYSWSWGGMLLMMLSWLFWFGLLGLLLWALFRWIGARTPNQGVGGSSAEEILRQRYARGEIDEATFERMRQQLGPSTTREASPTPPGR